MNPVQALAILSLGAFVTVLLTAIFYIFTIRPRLLEPVSLASLGMLDDKLRAELAEQREHVAQLNEALLHHTEALVNISAPKLDTGALAELHTLLKAQGDAARQITELLHAHGQRLAALDERVGRLSTRVSTLSEVDLGALRATLQTHSERLEAIGAQIEAWGAAQTGDDQRLAEYAHTLAQIDRALAAQAQVSQRIDEKLTEHTTLLVDAASERREQTGLLRQIETQVARLFPLLNRLLDMPPRPAQDRLTDIKGIGPVYAGKLYEAGIQTFKQLAAMSPDEILALLNVPSWRTRSIDVQHWIEQAKHLASQREKVESIR